MGNAGTALGDTMSCFRAHQNAQAVQATMTTGRDLDDAVLAAVNKTIENGQVGLVNTVRLSIACVDLPNLDTFTRTDGMAVLYKQVGVTWQKLGWTEVIMDSLSPQWVKQFDVQYNFEVREQYKITIFDVDDFNNIQNFEGHDLVGSIEFSLHEVVTQRDQTLERPLVNAERGAGKNGMIRITGEELKRGNTQELIMKPRATFSSQSGMNFFLVMKQIGQNNWKPVYKSEIKPFMNGAFEWNLINLLTTDIVNEGNIDQDFKIEFYSNQKSGRHTNLGSVNLTLAQVQSGQKEFLIVNRKGQTNPAHLLKFPQFELKKRFTFLDYIFGGCEIGLSVAIDFTLSNGIPSSPQSLHYLDLQKNEYLNAIKSVGNILQYYDHDKQIPALGFGAAIPPYNQKADHCFALNGDIFNPECDGIEGVMEAYKNAINRVNLYGPTHFASLLDLINEMTENMNVTQTNQKYNIMLIITDGVINDMQQTIDEVVRGSRLPLSIIIVGVGNADFSQMDQLDADEAPLYSQKYKRYMEADIVQFVPFREFSHNPMLLAKETLQEVPNQLLNFFRTKGINPNPATEVQKAILQSQLSKQNSLGQAQNNPHNVPMDDFFAHKKEQLLQKMQNQGVDFFSAQDFLENKGLYSLNETVLIQNLNNYTYVNPLKVVKQVVQPQQMNYAYNPNVPSMTAPAGQPVMMPQQFQGQQPQMAQPQMMQQMYQGSRV